MTHRGKEKLFGAIITALFLFGLLAYFVGFKIAWSIIGLHYFVPYIIAGFFLLALDIDERKWGSIIYGIIGIILVLKSLN